MVGTDIFKDLESNTGNCKQFLLEAMLPWQGSMARMALTGQQAKGRNFCPVCKASASIEHLFLAEPNRETDGKGVRMFAEVQPQYQRAQSKREGLSSEAML